MRAANALRSARKPPQQIIKYNVGAARLEELSGKPSAVWIVQGGTSSGVRTVGGNPAAIVEWANTFSVTVAGSNHGDCRDLRDDVIRGARSVHGPVKLVARTWRNITADARQWLKDGEAWELILEWKEATTSEPADDAVIASITPETGSATAAAIGCGGA